MQNLLDHVSVVVLVAVFYWKSVNLIGSLIIIYEWYSTQVRLIAYLLVENSGS